MTYDTSIIQHRILLKTHAKSEKKKMRQVNPMFLPMIEKEVRKLHDTKIILPIQYFDWVDNLVPDRKRVVKFGYAYISETLINVL